MRISFLILCLFSLAGYAQNKPDVGKVIGQDFSTCNSDSNGTICESKNELEISITRVSLPLVRYETVTLHYNNLKWQATKSKGWIGDSAVIFLLQPTTSFDQVFADLKTNKIFTLPDQKELKYQGIVLDGDEYFLTFKAGNKFRHYEFKNPRIFLELNKDIEEFQCYLNIATFLFEQLKKE